MFTLIIETTNAAFEDENEIPRILREVADKVLMGHESGTLRDINGNPVGTFRKTD